MVSIDELCIMMEWLKKKNLELTLEIQLITEWIKEHRESRPVRFEAVLSPADKPGEYRSWRMVSFRLHQRRSELKTKQEKIRTDLLVVNRRIEEMETCFFDAQVYFDTALETDLTSADACA